VPFGVEKVIEVGGKAYRGEILIYSTPEGRLIAVNRLSMEDYLRSVVPAEMGVVDRAGFESLKAQAVAARSYALTLVARNQSFHFDLTADTGDQVYGGLTSENPDADKAVFETAGECLLKGGQPVVAFYHSCCGGITADPEEVWGRQFAEANGCLRSVRDGTYDMDSKWYSWTVTWSRDKLLEILKSTLPTIVNLSSADIGEPTDLEIVEKGKSGRNELLKVITDRRVLQVQGDAIRRALRQPDGSLLPSTMFNLAVDRQGNGIVITASGKGFGHGLGLCQTGARARALEGQGYEKILDHYYHGVKIAKIY
jgi:stage II sporulation protein D